MQSMKWLRCTLGAAQHPELARLEPAPAAGALAAHAAQPQPATKRKRQEQYAWDAEALTDAAGSELCFEEVWLHLGSSARSALACDSHA